MPSTILLPLHGSADTERVTEYVLDRAVREGSVAQGLYVVDTARYGEPALSSGEVLIDDREDEGKRELAAFAARATAVGVDAETRCCHGRPNDELLRYAEEIDADVVVPTRRVPHDIRAALESKVGADVARPDSKRLSP